MRSSRRGTRSASLIVAGLVLAASLTGCLYGEVVSVAPGGPPADAVSRAVGISRDGQFVAFVSAATNLVPGDTNGLADLFVRDNATRAVQRVSLEADGTQLDSAGVTDGWISSDGSRAAFRTTEAATADDTDGLADVFSRRLATGQTVRATVQPAGVADEAWTGNPSKRGDLMVFAGVPTGFVFPAGSANYVYDLDAGTSTALPGAVLGSPRISDDGTVVAGLMLHPVSATASALFVSLKDAATGTVDQGVVVSDGSFVSVPVQRFDLTPDGRYVGYSFFSIASGIQGDVGRYDRITGSTVVAPGHAVGFAEVPFEFGTRISDDGRYLAYSRALADRQINYIPDFTVYDTATATVVTQVGRAPINTEPLVSISGDGRWVAFDEAQPMGAQDTNGLTDVVVVYGHDPVATSPFPAAIGSGSHTVTFSATGTLGLTGASVSGEGVAVTGVRVTSPTTVEVDVVVAPGATPGVRDVTLRNRGDWPGRPMVGAVGGCTACLTISG